MVKPKSLGLSSLMTVIFNQKSTGGNYEMKILITLKVLFVFCLEC